MARPILKLHNNATAVGDGDEFLIDTETALQVDISTPSAFVGTIVFETLFSAASGWKAVEGAKLPGDGTKASQATAVSSYLVPVVGQHKFRARISAFTSGQITVEARGVPGELLANFIDLDLTGSTITIGKVDQGAAGSQDWKVTDAQVFAGVGAPGDAEAAGNGSAIGIFKRLRTLLAGGLPAALTAGGGVKTGLVDALPAGTNNIGDVDVLTLPALPAGSNEIGKVVAAASADAVGATPFFDNSVAAAVEAMKAAAGNLYAVDVDNPNATDVYLQLFDVAAGSVVLGTTTPTLSLKIPPAGGRDPVYPIPFRFGTAISYAITTTATGSTAPASACKLNAGYK